MRISQLAVAVQKRTGDIPAGVVSIVCTCILVRFMQTIVTDAPVRTVLLTSDAEYLMVPDILTFLFSIHGAGLSNGFFWTPVTYMFLHGSTSHLVLNLVGLLTFGTAMEHVSGKIAMWSVFIASGIVGGIGWTLANGLGSAQPCIGASAGVLGLVGAYAAIRPRDSFTLIFPFPLDISSWVLAAILFLLNIVELFFIKSNVAYLAHLVGIIVGVACGFVLRHRRLCGTRDPA